MYSKNLQKIVRFLLWRFFIDMMKVCYKQWGFICCSYLKTTLTQTKLRVNKSSKTESSNATLVYINILGTIYEDSRSLGVYCMYEGVKLGASNPEAECNSFDPWAHWTYLTILSLNIVNWKLKKCFYCQCDSERSYNIWNSLYEQMNNEMVCS